ERLQTAIRESDALGRKGEDEFLILLSELITGDDDTPTEQKTNMIRKNIAIVVNRISECLSRPFNIQGQKFYVRASIGVSICPNDADSAQAMLEHADSAMYHAKETGRGRCVFYNNELHKRQERRLAMDSQLRLAMEKGEFVLQYQPIIEVIKGKGTIVGVEALLRWNHRIDGLLEPAAFLGIAE
ncbi:MAG: diguanylate cyclase, partial [Candidatus Eremiobacteraeota bacterium]|nr:diguanylate cyclase [Candidatus Eremiobacteraeota bacterium]